MNIVYSKNEQKLTLELQTHGQRGASKTVKVPRGELPLPTPYFTFIFSEDRSVLSISFDKADTVFGNDFLNKRDIHIHYDAKEDIAAVNFGAIRGGEIALTDSFSIDNLVPFGAINLDFDENNKLLGMEVFNAKTFLPADLLNNKLK
ncbi:hypothetical protein CO046_02905 [Candidatus Peregrinibacteria bacterium CG_4_9_14_0_2_um_filter_53_11]|nr:MAG: hypothetical protein CO046_02905 [Candidatus Peregrinibacteria bacterium CG_4_9_14_0_2_um_filter_53_11]